ncbi:hypothetical protein F511_30348 [Dorcoceras hygrometricum]|uniref:Uncharacterized protein n=1 Tax=Dorcoceras hygrometricum TaxID=472368 RepID=A0A2Z7B6F0_9LAMI|nr:hypothetical protein F511_30348 [Dorcoceras hygrometricum]
MGNADPHKTKAGNKYEVKPQYEERTKQINMQHAINQCYECMRAAKEISQLGQCPKRRGKLTQKLKKLKAEAAQHKPATHEHAEAFGISQLVVSDFQTSINRKSETQGVQRHKNRQKQRLDEMGIGIESYGEHRQDQQVSTSRYHLFLSLKTSSSNQISSRKKTLQNDTVPTYQNDIVALHQLVHLSLAKQPKAGTRSLQANTNGWSREINQNDDTLTNPNDIVKVTSASLPPAGSPVATHYSQQPLAAGSIRNTQNAAFQLHRTTSPRLPADDKYYFKNHQQLVTQATHILHNDQKPAAALNQRRRRVYTNKSSRCTYKTSRCTRKTLAAGYHVRNRRFHKTRRMQKPAVASGKLLLSTLKNVDPHVSLPQSFSRQKQYRPAATLRNELKPADAMRHAYVTLPMQTPAGSYSIVDQR